ncbi:PEP-CTERM sorting domain-containing protein [Rubritalea tangerina]|uniref:PEP-CTERM sorting domain-containing protein n=1 Tax=Rubritalea tangerina TaxID=430798 RepID=A0ABW4Z755_9BACT
MNLHYPIALLAISGIYSHAALNSIDFDYKYEMDVAPSTQDLDSNSTDDFFAGNAGTAGAELNNVTYNGGIGSFKDDNTPGNSSVIRADFTNSIWRNMFLSDLTWTAEARIQIVDDGSFPEGSNGTLVISGGIAGYSPFARVYKDRITFSNGATDVTYLNGTDFTSKFFDIRIAQDADGEGWLWVDGVLIAQDQAVRTGLSGGYANGFFIGGESFSSSVNGAWNIDYLRLDTDFQQVPEPTSTSLLGLASLSLLLRRKR